MAHVHSKVSSFKCQSELIYLVAIWLINFVKETGRLKIQQLCCKILCHTQQNIFFLNVRHLSKYFNTLPISAFLLFLIIQKSHILNLLLLSDSWHKRYRKYYTKGMVQSCVQSFKLENNINKIFLLSTDGCHRMVKPVVHSFHIHSFILTVTDHLFTPSILISSRQ